MEYSSMITYHIDQSYEENNQFFNLLVENNILTKYEKDVLRYDVLERVHWYGNHHNFNPEKTVNNKEKLKLIILKKARALVVFKNVIFNKLKFSQKIDISSNAYWNFDKNLENLGYSVSTPPWIVRLSLDYRADYRTFKKCNTILELLQNKDFNYLISQDFLTEFHKFNANLKEYYLNTQHKAIFLAADVDFFSNLSIKIFKEIEKPSFVYMHGLPPRYNYIDENRSDYLLVLGEKMKQAYINAGVLPNKIFAIGHPLMNNNNQCKNIRSGLSDVVVLTKAIPGKSGSTPFHMKFERSILLYYVYSIQIALKKLGISNAKLRCHPGEDINWYRKHLNSDFFTFDTHNIQTSLMRSTLVIGPSSTVFLESLYYGVNYIVYEPILKNNNSVHDYPLSPPFDGSDPRVAWSNNIEDLISLISNNIKTDLSLLNDYLNVEKPFNISFLKDLIR